MTVGMLLFAAIVSLTLSSHEDVETEDLKLPEKRK